VALGYPDQVESGGARGWMMLEYRSGVVGVYPRDKVYPYPAHSPELIRSSFLT